MLTEPGEGFHYRLRKVARKQLSDSVVPAPELGMSGSFARPSSLKALLLGTQRFQVHWAEAISIYRRTLVLETKQRGLYFEQDEGNPLISLKHRSQEQPGKLTLGKREFAMLQKWCPEGTCDSSGPTQLSTVHPLLPVPLACFISCAFALLLNNNLVIHSKLALRHATQVALHHHPARYMGAQHLPW